MGRIRHHFEQDRSELATRLCCRDDVLVREVRAPGADGGDEPTASASQEPAGYVVFVAAEGPFRRYRRTVRWSPADSPDAADPDAAEPDAAAAGDDAGSFAASERVAVDQSVEWTLAFPYWRWLFTLPLRTALRDGVPRGVRPWWSFPERLSADQATVVATMALLNMVAGLLFSVLTQALTFVSADIGDGSSSQQATVLAVVRVGSLLTVGIMAAADRVGRRRVALWSFGLATALCLATAAAPGMLAFTALQLLVRNLAIAGLLATDTISVEELPAGSRAMATGLGALAYGLGAGGPVLALFLVDVGPWGWRLVFLTSALAVPCLLSARRYLPESGRFTRMISVEPAERQRRVRGGRFLLLGAIFLLLNMFVAPASQLQNDYLRSERGFSGLAITLLIVLTSTPAALGVMAGGRLSDTRGRRVTLVPGLVFVGVGTALFFSLSGPPMWLAALAGSVLGALSVATLGVLAPELFPTARRGGARGALNLVAVGGSVIGLLCAGVLVDSRGYGVTFTLLAAGPLLAAVLAMWVPETGGRELEEINRDDDPPSAN